jgi:hypothetical protein
MSQASHSDLQAPFNPCLFSVIKFLLPGMAMPGRLIPGWRYEPRSESGRGDADILRKGGAPQAIRGDRLPSNVRPCTMTCKVMESPGYFHYNARTEKANMDISIGDLLRQWRSARKLSLARRAM